MSYIIKNADGTILLNLVDGTVDAKTTSLTLIGKNTDAYGTSLNTNLVNILQNFASNSQPRSPLVGQLWYDTASGRLRVFNLDGIFGELTAAILSQEKPTTLKQGDIWIDTKNDQMYFTKDGLNTVLAGPVYSSVYGKSGWVMEEVLDTGDTVHIVTGLYSNDKLLGILSTSSFELNETGRIQGMQYITAGLTLNTSIPGIRFAGTSTNADAILGIHAQDYLLNNNNNQDQQIVGTGALSLLSDAGIEIGLYRDFAIFTGGGVGSRNAAIRNNIVDGTTQFLTIKSYPTGPDAELVSLSLKGDRVGINTNSPSNTLHVNGGAYFKEDVYMASALYVLGTFTSVSSQLVQLADKNIELGVPSAGAPTDLLADGGGITLKATTDKTFVYSNSETSWSSNIDLNVHNTRSYKIGGMTVLTSSTLGSTVINSSIRRLGVLTELTVTNVIIKGSGITVTNAVYTIAGASSTATDIGSLITVTLASPVPILSSGTTVQVLGIADLGYNGTYQIADTTSSYHFKVFAKNTLSSTTAVLGATPTASFTDLMLSSTSGNIDVTKKRITNVQYSTVPTDAATVQFAIDAGSVSNLKGFVITLDVSRMTNLNVEIINILNALAPTVNTPPAEYQNDYQYDLPIGYRARVLCQTNTIPVPALPINVSKTNTAVQSYPNGTEVSVISNIAVTSVGVATTATMSYTIKEFRVAAGTPPVWQFYRNITF